MKKEKIYNIVIACICLALLFMPLETFNYAYVFTLRLFFESAQSGGLFTPVFLGELLTVFLGIIAITLLAIDIYTNKLSTKILVTASSLTYVIMWFVQIFAKFQSRTPVYKYFVSGSHILWLLLYIALLLTIVVLNVLRYLQYLPHRRPTKTERMQAKIDDLQQQIDELKKGD